MTMLLSVASGFKDICFLYKHFTTICKEYYMTCADNVKVRSLLRYLNIIRINSEYLNFIR